MKLLFLDIDGVCNSRAFAEREYKRTGKGGMLGIDPTPAALVRRIIEQTGCVVVLSSYWRLRADDRAKVRKEVCEFIGVTMHLPSAWRGEEVRHWILDNVQQQDLEAYAILDDDSDFGPDQPLFKTSFDTGLTDEIAQSVIAHLNGRA